MRVTDTKLLLTTIKRKSSSNRDLCFEESQPHPLGMEPYLHAGPAPTKAHLGFCVVPPKIHHDLVSLGSLDNFH